MGKEAAIPVKPRTAGGGKSFNYQAYMPKIRAFLFPRAAERNEDFRREIHRLARRSLYVISVAYASLTLLGYPLSGLLPTLQPRIGLRVGITVVFFLLAGAAFGIARSRWGASCSRSVAILWGVAASVLVTWFILQIAVDLRQADSFFLIENLTLILVVLAVVPALPVQMFLFGIAIEVVYLVLFQFASHWNAVTGSTAVGLGVVTLVCTFLSAVNYRRLWATYLSHEETMSAQSRLLLSRHAASLGKLAAALSHELNTPLGAARSSAQTLVALVEKHDTASAEERPRLAGLIRDLCRAIDESTVRQEEVINRLQRFTNLDRAEVQSVDLKRLLEDAASLIGPGESEKVHLELDLPAMPRVTCRPQQLSAVFSGILQNAVDAVPIGGRVRVAASRQDSQVEVVIADNGPGISPPAVASIFEPRFRILGDRVATGNWTLFASRRIIHEHGGKIDVVSPAGGGTTVTITLPADTPAALGPAAQT